MKRISAFLAILFLVTSSGVATVSAETPKKSKKVGISTSDLRLCNASSTLDATLSSMLKDIAEKRVKKRTKDDAKLAENRAKTLQKLWDFRTQDSDAKWAKQFDALYKKAGDNAYKKGQVDYYVNYVKTELAKKRDANATIIFNKDATPQLALTGGAYKTFWDASDTLIKADRDARDEAWKVYEQALHDAVAGVVKDCESNPGSGHISADFKKAQATAYSAYSTSVAKLPSVKAEIAKLKDVRQKTSQENEKAFQTKQNEALKNLKTVLSSQVNMRKSQ